jgi:hypothetical protein
MDPPMEQAEWVIDDVSSDVSIFHHDDNSFNKGILYISSNEALIPVHLKKKEWGVMRINSNGKVLWQTNIASNILGMGRMKEKVIVFFKEDNDKEGLIKVAVLDIGSGEKLEEKTAFGYAGEHGAEILIQNTSIGDFSHIIIRSTGEKGGYFRMATGRQESNLQTTKCEAVFFDDAGNLTERFSLNIPKESEFLGTLVTSEKNICVIYKEAEQIAASMYDASGKLSASLQTPFAVRKNTFSDPTIQIDSRDPKKIWLSIRYVTKDKNAGHRLINFDFGARKATVSEEEIFGKEYGRSIQFEEVDKVKKGGTKDLESLQPTAILANGENIIVIKEAKYSFTSDRGSTRYITDGLILSFYNRQAKHLKTIGLDKTYEAFIPLGRSVGYHMYGKKLYLTTVALAGIGAYSNLLCIVDTDAMKFEQFTILDRGRLGRDRAIEPAATLWFEKSALASYIIPVGGLMIREFNAVLQKINF